MFDFEKLQVYSKAKAFNNGVYKFLQESTNLDRTTRDQFRRASFSIMLNLAEGSGRFSQADRKNFFVIARGSVFECVAILDFLHSQELISKELYTAYYLQCEELSKIIYAMIKNLSK